MPRPPNLWVTITIRVAPDAVPVIDMALERFWRGERRPATNPVALGFMLEALSADFLAGPGAAHPSAAAWTPRGSAAGGDPAEPSAEEDS